MVNKLIDNKYELLDLKTKKVGGTLSVLSDSSLIIVFSSDPNTSLTMVANVTFERLFNRLKSKNNFKCISSNEISYNNIVCYKTSVNSYLSNPGYKSKTQQVGDEVYGKEEKKYLDNNGNKYYYSVKDGNNFFYKIELINAKTLSPYLGITVGDRMSRVKETLSSKSIVFTESKSSLRVRICNAMFEGAFGSLLYKFEEADKKDAYKSLISVVYTPLNEE